MAVDALCNLLTSGAVTATVSAGSWFDLKTQTPLEGLPIKLKVSAGAGSSSPTMTVTLQVSDDASTVAETVFSKVITYTTSNYGADMEDIYTIVSQHRYIRAGACTLSGTLSTGTSITWDIVAGRQNP
jgi:hypothetical protein